MPVVLAGHLIDLRTCNPRFDQQPFLDCLHPERFKLAGHGGFVRLQRVLSFFVEVGAGQSARDRSLTPSRAHLGCEALLPGNVGETGGCVPVEFGDDRLQLQLPGNESIPYRDGGIEFNPCSLGMLSCESFGAGIVVLMIGDEQFEPGPFPVDPCVRPAIDQLQELRRGVREDRSRSVIDRSTLEGFFQSTLEVDSGASKFRVVACLLQDESVEDALELLILLFIQNQFHALDQVDPHPSSSRLQAGRHLNDLRGVPSGGDISLKVSGGGVRSPAGHWRPNLRSG